jgi:hypothetical protein
VKLAVLGTDLDVVALLAAAVADGHAAVWLGDVRPQDEAALRKYSSQPQARTDQWETLLDHATADAVIVGRGTAGDELRGEQLKRLVTDAVPTLIIHPAGLSVLTYYELDMVRRETGAILRHFNPLAGHPKFSEIAQWVREGHENIGSVVQVTCTRHIRGGSREEVLAGLARDAELLAAVAGDIRQVSAIGPREMPGATRPDSAPMSYASLQVQMTSTVPATLRWSVVPATSEIRTIELALIGERGTIVMTDADLQFDAPRAAIMQLAAAVEQKVTDNASTWDKATRAMEVVDAVELSLQRGRTIEVHQQQLTEQLAFRGTMAALGCGLLLLATVVVIVAGMVGGADWLLQRKVMPSWPVALLAVLAFFLLLQTVPWLASRKRTRRETENEGSQQEIRS